MLLNNSKQTVQSTRQAKYFSLNTNNKTDTTKWNIPSNYNFSQKAKMALVSTNNATDSNLNLTFCPTIKNNYFSSLNTSPLIYAGIGYNNQNIINGKQYYDVNGAFLNEIELKTFSSPPQNDFSYPELASATRPNLWLKFDTGAITTNDGTDAITISNTGTTNAGVSIRGNNSATFNGSAYVYGNMEGFVNNSFSVSVWCYTTTAGSNTIFNMGANNLTLNKTLTMATTASGSNLKYNLKFYSNDCETVNDYNDVNNWVYLTFTYDYLTGERSIYRNGVKLAITNAISTTGGFTGSNILYIGIYINGTALYNGRMDDLRVYTGKVLDQDQINTIYGYRQNYPIIKNETLRLANPADNDPNIHTIPNVWLRFETGALTTNSGTTTFLIGNVSNFVVNAGVSVRGNNSASFNGSSYLFTASNYINLSSKTFTVSVWMFPKSTNTCTVVGFGGVLQAYRHLYMGFTGGAYYINNLNTEAFSADFSSDVNTWVHLVFIFDSITLERSIYRNGVKLVLSNPKANGQNNLSSNVSIGVRSGGDYLNGYLDDFRIYIDKPLDQEEITRIYNGTKTDYTTQITEPTIGMDLTPNLWLKFDTGALLINDGTDAITLTNNNNATNAGISIRGNNSLGLNGTNQYLSGTGVNLTNNGSFSISVWFYPKVLSAVAYNIICQFYKTGQTFWVNFPNTYKYEFGIAGMSAILTTSTFATDLKNWVHLVFTYDNTTKKVLIYRYGVLLATSANTITAGLFGYENTNFTIGATNTNANFFNGNIDDVRVYNRVLSQAQITELYAGNSYYNLPTAFTRYNTDPINTQYQFEVVDDEQKIISHY